MIIDEKTRGFDVLCVSMAAEAVQLVLIEWGRAPASDEASA